MLVTRNPMTVGEPLAASIDDESLGTMQTIGPGDGAQGAMVSMTVNIGGATGVCESAPGWYGYRQRTVTGRYLLLLLSLAGFAALDTHSFILLFWVNGRILHVRHCRGRGWHPRAQARKDTKLRLDWLLPICQAALSEDAVEVSNPNIQIRGGHGFAPDSGAKQFCAIRAHQRLIGAQSFAALKITGGSWRDLAHARVMSG